MGAKILVVDDEKNIVDILSFNLLREGYEVIKAYDGREALKCALEENPDLILLDVMLPYMDGFEVCRSFREKNNTTPVIMLTAREEERDKVLGLEIGADDYITKPFSVRELLARVKTNIRRSIPAQSSARSSEGRFVKIAGLQIDMERGELLKNGRNIELTAREVELLTCMLSEPGKVFSREELMTRVWNYEYYGDLRTVDVAIRRLREKIEDSPAEPRYIITKRGLGYYLNAD